MYKIGMRFTVNDCNWEPRDTERSTYILAQSDNNMVCLIDLSSGNRWVEPVYVKNVNNITEEEWKEITDYRVGEDYNWCIK